jgi:hypothetical protein
MAKKDKEEEEEKIDHQFSSVTHRQQVRALNWNFFFSESRKIIIISIQLARKSHLPRGG